MTLLGPLRALPKFQKCFIILSLNYTLVIQLSEVQFSWGGLSFLRTSLLSNLEKGIVRQAAWHNGKYTGCWNLTKLDLNPSPDTYCNCPLTAQRLFPHLLNGDYSIIFFFNPDQLWGLQLSWTLVFYNMNVTYLLFPLNKDVTIT